MVPQPRHWEAYAPPGSAAYDATASAEREPIMGVWGEARSAGPGGGTVPGGGSDRVTGLVANSEYKIQALFKDFQGPKLHLSSTKIIDIKPYPSRGHKKFRAKICSRLNEHGKNRSFTQRLRSAGLARGPGCYGF